MMSLVVEVLLTVPPGGASLTHISQADGNSEGGAGVCVYMRECVWEQKMEMWGVAFEETLQLLCAGMRETRSCFIYLFFILYFFPNSDHPFSRVLQLLSTHMMCSFLVGSWKLKNGKSDSHAPKVGKTCLALLSTTNIYLCRFNQLTALYPHRHVWHILKVLQHCQWAVSQRIDTAEPQI